MTKYVCTVCGYVYDEAAGEPDHGVAPGTLWADVQADHFRQARILVTGSNLKYHSDWFNGILEPVSILSSLRGNIPQ